MKAIAALLITLFFFVGQSSPQRYCGNNANAVTLKELSYIPGDARWHKTALELTVTKLQDASTLDYICQITFQQSITAPIGNQFMIRVRNQDGVYVMPDMKTGEPSAFCCAPYNAIITDLVYDKFLDGPKAAGVYTFELWALTGYGELLIVPYQSTITVKELPHAVPCG